MLSIGFRWPGLVNIAIALLLVAPAVTSAAVARMQTSLGNFDVQLYDAAAPLTVANFLKYVRAGAYNQSFIHRSVPGFIIQGGGYTWVDKIRVVPKGAPVQNEFSRTRSNLRGTIAMAKVAGDPDSATSEWFFNLADNSMNLDNQNGGFTVFGKVLFSGMKVVDAIAALPVANAGGAFGKLPYMPPIANHTLQKQNLVMLSRVSVSVPASTNAKDRVFSYLEGAFPRRFLPASSLAPNAAVSKSAPGYYYRYYARSRRYLAAANGVVYWGAELNGSMISLGSLRGLLAKAARLGY